MWGSTDEAEKWVDPDTVVVCSHNEDRVRWCDRLYDAAAAAGRAQTLIDVEVELTGLAVRNPSMRDWAQQPHFPFRSSVRSICDAVLALEAERSASGVATGGASGQVPLDVLSADVQPRGISIGERVLLYTLVKKKEGGGYVWLMEEADNEGTSVATLRTVSCLPHVAGRMMMSRGDRPEPQLLALPVKPADCVTCGRRWAS